MPGPKGNMGITYTSAKGQKGIRGPIGPPGPPGTTSAEFTGNNETLIGKIVPYRIHTQLIEASEDYDRFLNCLQPSLTTSDNWNCLFRSVHMHMEA